METVESRDRSEMGKGVGNNTLITNDSPTFRQNCILLYNNENEMTRALGQFCAHTG